MGMFLLLPWRSILLVLLSFFVVGFLFLDDLADLLYWVQIFLVVVHDDLFTALLF